MWTFPILIVVLLYAYVVLNKDDPADNPGLDSVKITDSQEQPEDKPDQPADNGQASNPPATDSGTEGTGEGDAGGNGGGTDTEGQTDGQTDGTEEEPEPPVDNSSSTVTVAEDGKSGNITNFKVNGSAGQPVTVTIKATGHSWLEVYKGENSSGEKLEYGNTAEGDSFTFELDSAGMYIKSGYAAATTIEVGGKL